MADIKPTPLPRREFINKITDPYIKEAGKPPLPVDFNRAEQISVRDDNSKVIKVGIEDIDSAIQFYFDNVIQPYVYQNANRIKVPVIIASPERFKSMQTDGFYRDKNGKIMVPLITYKRDSITKNRELGNKLDGNSVANIQTFEQKFNKRNVYDNWSVLRNTKPNVARRIGIIPDYVTLSYSCVLFTNYIEQNNNLIESIQFASDAYWGDLNAFAFRTRIESFNSTTFLDQGDDRAAKTTFELKLNGYLIPNVLNKDLAVIQNKIYDKSKIVFTAETVSKLP